MVNFYYLKPIKKTHTVFSLMVPINRIELFSDAYHASILPLN